MLQSTPVRAVAWLAMVPQIAVAAAPSRIQQGRDALTAAARAYQTIPGLKETFVYVVKGANADRQPKEIEIRLGSGTDASVYDGFICAVAVGSRFFVTKSDAPAKYVERPFTGDFGKALSSVFGGGAGPFEPVQIAMRSHKDIGGWLEALRFNLLGKLRISNFARLRGADGVEKIMFTAENGRLELGVDSRSHFLASAHLWMQSPGSSGDPLVEIEGRWSREIISDPSSLVAFDPGSRQTVPDASNLDSATLPTGKPAPGFALRSVSGRRVSLDDFRDRMVVLDFWATWCAPCWQALRETQELADWAESAHVPVTVLAVNTMETSPSEDQRKTRILDFFRAQRLSMTCLLDEEAEVFKSFGSPGLPSTVLVAPGGKIARYHQGAIPNLAATLKREIAEALASGPRAPPN